ncbi:hypothetical protein Btru_056631 [Bulinus truncatus]|nr:hypothetical protein Btru_056631 [Bulinus truncatus]
MMLLIKFAATTNYRIVYEIRNAVSNSAVCHPHCSPNDVHCSEQVCCGNMKMSKSNSKCCFNNKIDLSEQQKLDIDFIDCCGEAQIYDVRIEICCEKNVYPLSYEGKNLQCCGTKSFMPWRNSCLATTDTFGKKKYTIGDSNEAVCGDDQIYNRLTAGCCKNAIVAVPEINNWQPNPNFGCCDHLLMNPLKEKCCRKHHYFYFDSHLIPNKTELDCCGTGYYNRSAEICNNGTVVKKQLDKKLCGYTYYDPKVEGCCDFVIYEKRNSKCCKGSTRSVARLEDKCCNGVGMDKNHICCEGLLAKKNRQDDVDCCFSNDFTKAKAYSRALGERCYQGNIISGYREGTEPCGAHGYYDPRMEICCNNNVFNASYDCCDGEAYKKENQMCCFDKVQNLPTALGNCCDIDEKAYRFNDQSNPCKSLCGTTLYDNAKEVCCENQIYREKRDFECCGNAYININRKEWAA